MSTDLRAYESTIRHDLERLDMDTRFAKVDTRFARLEGKLTLLHWMLGATFAGVEAIVATLFF